MKRSRIRFEKKEERRATTPVAPEEANLGKAGGKPQEAESSKHAGTHKHRWAWKDRVGKRSDGPKKKRANVVTTRGQQTKKNKKGRGKEVPSGSGSLSKKKLIQYPT